MMSRSNKRKREMDPVAEVNAASLVSIRKSDVPVYLQQGEFFQSFSTDVEDNEEDDEVIFVPKNTLKADLTIENCENLDHLLSSLRYWGIDRMIPEIVDFVVGYSATDTLAYTLHHYKNDFNYVSALYFAVAAPIPKPGGHFLTAAQHGDLDLLRYLREKLGTLRVSYSSLIDAASLGGYTECVKYLVSLATLRKRTRGYCDESAFRAACQSGNLECLVYVYSNLHIRAMRSEFFGNLCVSDRNIDCYIYAYQHCQSQFYFTIGDLACVVLYNGIASIQYGVQHGLRLESELYYFVLPGNLDVMEGLYAAGCPLPADACTYFAREGEMEYLKFAHEKGCNLDRLETAQIAMVLRNKIMFQYVLCQSGPLTSALLVTAVNGKERWCTEYLCNRGCPMDATVTAAAAEQGSLSILKDLHRRGCPWDASACVAAAKNDWLRELTYLHEQGCPCDYDVYRVALAHNSIACLKYLRKHGFSIK